MSNKKSGNKFENVLAELYSQEGYWVHLVEPGKDGSQPCDLIAVKSDSALLIDAKVLDNTTGTFPFARIEENQRLAYKHWCRCGNDSDRYKVAILWNHKVHVLRMSDIMYMIECHDGKSINLKKGHWVQFENIYI